jgi:hypothetical protein
MIDEKLTDYLKGLKHGLFSSRDSAKEGFKYAYDLIETIPKKYRHVAFTALHVSVNSISDDISKLIQKNS